jgi:hypothetical protein
MSWDPVEGGSSNLSELTAQNDHHCRPVCATAGGHCEKYGQRLTEQQKCDPPTAKPDGESHGADAERRPNHPDTIASHHRCNGRRKNREDRFR